jgi:hypothetical protein
MMGSSPSASLYWGFDLGDMTDQNTWDSLKPAWMYDEEEGDTERDWKEELATRLGWKELPAPKGWPDYTASTEEKEAFHQSPVYLAWSANRSEMYALTERCFVELDSYGSEDVPRYCVRVSPSVQEVDSWGSIKVQPLEVAPDWREKLTQFMKLLELPMPEGEEPGWHLNCSYG